MAVSIDLVYRYVQEIISKELGSGYLDPTQFSALSNVAVTELFNKYSAIYQQEQRVTDKILPFITKAILPVDTNGRMLYPSDYVTQVAIRAFDPDSVAAAIALCDDETTPINYNEISEIEVKVIDNNKVGNRLSSSYLSPDKYRPMVTYYSSYAQWHPANIGQGIFEYLKQPVSVLWDFTVGANGLEVYNPVTSIDFEFGWIMQNELIIKICSYFGVSIRETDLVQASQMMQSQQA